MPVNLEVKAAYPSLSRAVRIAQDLHARRVGTLRQVDTYFRVSSGRLKLREINSTKSELIVYRRSNRNSRRLSTYEVFRIPSPQPLKRVLTSLFGVLAIVAKTRRLFLYKNARIHLDSVRGLGHFLEFEVQVVRGNHQAQALMAELVKVFSVSRPSIIGYSYSDLLLQSTKRKS